MAEPVSVNVIEGIAVVTLDHPPVNVLNADVRKGLSEAFTSLKGSDVHAVVLLSEGKDFCGGLDLREMDKAPEVGEIARQIEDFDKPVIVGLQGRALGAGAALALAAHYRIAAPDARIAFPEIRLGLLPGAGSTQRLPRLIGDEALILMLNGGAIKADTAERFGLIDRISKNDIVADALHYARNVAATKAGPRPTLKQRLSPEMAETFSQSVAAARSEAKSRAALAVIECIEATQLLPAEAGLSMEQAAGEECWDDPGSRASRYLFQAERRGVDKGKFERIVAVLMGAYFTAETTMSANASDIQGAWRDMGWAMEGAGAGPSDGAALRIKSLAAMVNAGAQLIAQGETADLIDLAMVQEAGFPRTLGGPMYYASTLGLAGLVRRMEQWQSESQIWTPHALLKRAMLSPLAFEGINDDA